MCVFASLGLIPLTLFSICGFTDMASNTAVTQSTLTDSMMLTHATCACSFAFGLSVATPPKAAVRRLSQDWPLRCFSGFSSSMGWEAAPSQKVSNFVESGSRMELFTQRLYTVYLQCRWCHPRENGPYSGSINTGLIILKKFDVHSSVDGGRRLR